MRSSQFPLRFRYDRRTRWQSGKSCSSGGYWAAVSRTGTAQFRDCKNIQGNATLSVRLYSSLQMPSNLLPCDSKSNEELYEPTFYTLSRGISFLFHYDFTSEDDRIEVLIQKTFAERWQKFAGCRDSRVIHRSHHTGRVERPGRGIGAMHELVRGQGIVMMVQSHGRRGGLLLQHTLMMMGRRAGMDDAGRGVLHGGGHHGGMVEVRGGHRGRGHSSCGSRVVQAGKHWTHQTRESTQTRHTHTKNQRSIKNRLWN